MCCIYISICKERRLKVDNIIVNLIHEETVVNLCDTYRVENTQVEEHVMILDPSALINLAGWPWLSKYMAEFDYKICRRYGFICMLSGI